MRLVSTGMLAALLATTFVAGAQAQTTRQRDVAVTGSAAVERVAPRQRVKAGELARLKAEAQVAEVPVRRRCATIACPEFVLIGVGF